MWPTPTPASVFRERRARLASSLGQLRALISAGTPQARNYPANRYPFRASSHFLYLVGRALPGAVLLLGGGTAPTLFVPERPRDDAMWHGEQPDASELADALALDVRPLGELERSLSGPANVATFSPNDDATAAWLSQLLERAIVPRASAALHDGSSDAALAEAMIRLRLQHDFAAVVQLREAAKVTTRAHALGLAASRPGARETEVVAAMLGAMTAAGMGPAYEPIVTVHGEVLHHGRHDNVLQAGDLLLVDVGAETPEGFASDVTRVWPVGGRFSPSQRALYEVVLHAQEVAIAMVVPGTRYRAIHEAAARVIAGGLVELGILRGDPDDLCARGAYAPFFPHGVGHLIGADVHDMEDLGDRAGYAPGRVRSTRFGDRYLRLDRDLEVGMAVTIEPGFYQVPAILGDRAIMEPYANDIDRDVLAKFGDVRGIRIEDDVLVTSGAPEVLSRAIPKSPVELESILAGAA